MVNTLINFLKSDSPPKVFLKYYLIIIFLGAILLKLPFSLNEGVNISFLDAIFTSTSAVSVTGLTTITTVDTYSLFGQVVIMTLIILGGLGVMAVKASLFLLFGLKIGTKNRQLIMNEQQHFNINGMAKLVKRIILITVVVTAIGFIALTYRFYVTYGIEFRQSIWFGLFHSVSAVNNAGFDLFGNSLLSFKDDYFIQTIFIILIIFGGIGFPIIIELSRYFKNKFSKVKYKFSLSLFAKLTLSTYFIILVVGFLFIFFVEYKHGLAYGDNTFSDKVFMALFQSVTTRNAGFATTDLSIFSNATIVVMTIMMFIGAAPSSTGGGIRTTTFAIIALFVYNKVRDRDHVIAFKRKVPNITIATAFLTFTLGIVLIFVSTIIILMVENYTSTSVLFEVTSAFGTTGLSTGITSQLSPISKLVLIVVMFSGQIGIITVVKSLRTEEKKEALISYAEENVLIG